ncbi:MAG: aminotransferase class I/II-fold pyridoxal phosphate-dependent enzyme [Planctomycetes bacterium]|nr:aminotransferase class I/II-fold pyridoxal phosphate-dependent enzyme [Planctomycetota bacterium]
MPACAVPGADPAERRRRIRAAFDPELFRAAGRNVVEQLADHLSRVESSSAAVLNWRPPPENVAAARRLLEEHASDAAPSAAMLAERFAGVVATMLDRGHNLHDPRYIGHQVPASVPLAGLFDAVGSVTNQVMAIYEMGPWASAVETAMVEVLGEQIGWQPGRFAGFVTHGGSLANLTALLTARNVSLAGVWEQGVRGGDQLPPNASARRSPVLVAHAEAHYCIARSAGILGLGTGNVIRAALDERRRIDPNRLDETLARLRAENRPIVAVVACACATPVGAFDPLEDIADVCRRHDVWMHVDAAHGAAACLSDRYRHLVAGLDRADSLVWDAHKMLFVPALCAFVFYRDRERRFEAFRQDAPYLFDPSAPGLAEFDSGLKTVECTKRAAAFGLWGVWTLFGRQLFADMVDETFDLGRLLYEKLRSASDFEPLHEPQCNIVVFRHVPEALRDAPPERLGAFQLDLRRAVIESGEFYIVPTAVGGVGALRVSIINPLTTPDHFDALLAALREHGRRLVARR